MLAQTPSLTQLPSTSLSPGAAVRISGPWCASPGSGQPHELRASHVQVLGENDAEHHPIQPKFHTSEYLRTIPHLRSRIPAHALRLRLRSHVIASATSYFHAQGFVQTHPPIITSSDCEGAGEVFVVSPNSNQQPHPTGDEWDQAPLQPGEQHQYFFRTPKYLTVSAQLHLEALAHAVTRVWTLSPAFRAERSDTPRHLSEFYMLEAELCFTQTLEDVMTVLEGLLSSIAADLHRSVVGDELLRSHHADDGGEGVTPALLAQRWVGMYSTPWPRITYADAISLLQRAVETGQTTFVVAPSYDVGLQAEHERHLAATLGGREQRPVFVTDYPRKQKAFYMSPSSASALSSEDDEGDDGTAACFDLLVPSHCELAGGSLREHRAAALEAALRARGLGEGGGLEWYGDLRRYGAAPHGGFGLGFDRLLAYLAGVGNVRDVVAFPRWVGRCVC